VTDRQLRNRHHLGIDALLLALGGLAAYTLRFEGLGWLDAWGGNAATFLVVSIPVRLGVFYLFGMYRSLWYLASVSELDRVLRAGIVAGTLSTLFGAIVLPMLGWLDVRVPLGVLGLDFALTCGSVALSRFLPRLLWWRKGRRATAHGERVLIVGAGQAGQMTARELNGNPRLQLTPVGFVDDDVSKHGQHLMGIPVMGALADLPAILLRHSVNQLIIAMPASPGSVVRDVVRAALDAGVHTRTMPGLYEILSGKQGVSHLRDVEIQDLLRRAPIDTDVRAMRKLVSGRQVVITGAGGSIGSELCRQIARLGPSHMLLLGHGENSIFEIVEELRERVPTLRFSCVIADIRDRPRIEATFQRFRPHVVFHAAAHKHVPLMEENIMEAVTNNVIGTQVVVNAAVRAGTPNFVLISSDKAVRPSSIMGATKRIAEQITQIAAETYGHHYVSVRFGNVLGSRGSVVPTFLRQIRAGGPVTVTDPDMTRYFLTIPEAVQLVMQAATLGAGGDVFVLDMGEPVRIADLARDLIRLSGLQEGRDVEICYTGRRPGEKLYEEVFFQGEEVVATSHPKVLSARNLDVSADAEGTIDRLVRSAARNASDEELVSYLRYLVPEFQRPQDEGIVGNLDVHIERSAARERADAELRASQDARLRA
jgi:FlaA1/EpsC-like NDP-sugar epimerase